MKPEGSPENETIERRVFTSAELRVGGSETEPVIEGYAAVFGSRSEDLGGFVETIERGFFRDVLQDDVRALWNHDPNFILGRTKSGTMTVEEDDKGLRVTIKPPSTTLVSDLVLTPMRRGDISQMSFAFSVRENGDTWLKENGQWIRTLKAGGCARLYDGSPVTYPAYPETSVTVRSKLTELRSQEQTSQGQEPAADAEAEQAQARLQTRKRLLDLAEDL